MQKALYDRLHHLFQFIILSQYLYNVKCEWSQSLHSFYPLQDLLHSGNILAAFSLIFFGSTPKLVDKGILWYGNDLPVDLIVQKCQQIQKLVVRIPGQGSQELGRFVLGGERNGIFSHEGEDSFFCHVNSKNRPQQIRILCSFQAYDPIQTDLGGGIHRRVLFLCEQFIGAGTKNIGCPRVRGAQVCLVLSLVKCSCTVKKQEIENKR